jgi:peptidoglycan/LPS O-acetylase OafA/YrhL
MVAHSTLKSGLVQSKQGLPKPGIHGKHMPQLDGLRALAVAAVVWSHWLPTYCFGIQLGQYGVHLFFVLSGFLITGILLDARERDGNHRAWALRQFYIRRSLRIFPVFYATIAICSLVDLHPYRETWIWHASYLSNIYFFLRGEWHGPISHLWSLAVEEQFYLLWPFLIVFAPRRSLLPVICAAILFAPLFRSGISSLYPSSSLGSLLMPGCLDSLGAGALTSWLFRSPTCQNLNLTALVLTSVGILGYGATVVFGCFENLRITSYALACAGLVLASSAGFQGVIGSFLENRILRYFGRISYGIYVFHLLAFPILQFLLYKLPGFRVFERLGVESTFYTHPIVTAFMLGIITISMAACSWTLFEGPICSLKRHFPMTRTSSSDRQ